MKIVRSEEEIRRVLEWANNNPVYAEYGDRSYEMGVKDVLDWIIGDTDVAPDEC